MGRTRTGSAAPKVKHSRKHPGFRSTARSISRKQHIPVARANRILAAARRKASPRAVRKNPRLRRIAK